MVKLKHFIKEEVDYNKITPNNIGVEGERYICDDNILKKTYDIMG